MHPTLMLMFMDAIAPIRTAGSGPSAPTRAAFAPGTPATPARRFDRAVPTG